MNQVENGLIIKSISGEYSVYISKTFETIVCKPRGVFRHNDETVKVGDYCTINKETKTILDIKPRKNDLIRPVISNVDKAFIVTSLKEPDINLTLLDKLIAIMEYNDIEVIIIFSKEDLVGETNNKEYQKLKEYYQSIGYKVYFSTKNSFDRAIMDELSNSICALVGQSGVGKSTLLNNMDKALTIKTDIISKALNRGKHTTRHIELYPINNGYLADSPGFGSIDFDLMDELALSHSFKEFFTNSDECKYNKCLHINEPACNIKKLVADNVILKSRYDNYLLFNKEIKERMKVQYKFQNKKRGKI